MPIGRVLYTFSCFGVDFVGVLCYTESLLDCLQGFSNVRKTMLIRYHRDMVDISFNRYNYVSSPSDGTETGFRPTVIKIVLFYQRYKCKHYH